MKARAPLLLLAVFIATVLGGCAGPPTRTADLDCRDTPDCRVQVSVNCVMAIFCSISADHDRVIGRRNGKIDWEVVTPGYTFDRANGIVFPTAPAVFRCQPQAAGQRFSCDNRGDSGEYKYTINLVGSPAVGSLDPWVVNN